MPPRARLDSLLVERGLAPSRERARALVLAGKVLVNGVLETKAGAQIKPDAALTLKAPDIPFVGRGGVKLEGALQALEMAVEGRVFLDIGASTGGFTDCLLQRGAQRVYAIDVGHGLLDWRLRNDPRVVTIERLNARYLDQHPLPEQADGVVIDVSFISLTLILPPLRAHLKPGGEVMAMVKPQFEVGPEEVGRTGVVRDEEVRQRAIQTVTQSAQANGFRVLGGADSTLAGVKGNVEHFLWLQYAPVSETTV